MKLVVEVTCAECRSTRTVYILGRWDLTKFTHECPTPEHPSGVWVPTFTPDRAVY